MPFRGISCLSPDFSDFFRSVSRSVLWLFFGFGPVDKSVNKRIGRESVVEPVELAEKEGEILVFRRSAPLHVEEIRIGYDRGESFSEPAAGEKP